MLGLVRFLHTVKICVKLSFPKLSVSIMCPNGVQLSLSDERCVPKHGFRGHDLTVKFL